jgi:hypothetical protein
VVNAPVPVIAPPVKDETPFVPAPPPPLDIILATVIAVAFPELLPFEATCPNAVIKTPKFKNRADVFKVATVVPASPAAATAEDPAAPPVGGTTPDTDIILEVVEILASNAT